MKNKAFLFIILAGILWGTSGIFVHYLAPLGFTSMQMTATRASVSFLCMLGYVLVRNRRLFCARPREILFFIAAGVLMFGSAFCYYTAMQMTSIATAVVLMYTAPIYVMIFSVLFLGEKLSPLKTGAVICMLVGCALVSGIIGGLKFDVLGLLVGALTGIVYGGYNIVAKIAMNRGNPPVTVTLYAFLTMALIAVPLCRPGELAAAALERPIPAIPLLLGLGVCTFVMPYFLYTAALRDLPAGTASALSIVEPMAATVFSVVLFDEKLTVFSATGILLIFTAVFLLSRAEDRQEKQEKQAEKQKECEKTAK